MPFLTMSNADVNFQARDLQWRFYTTRDVLPMTKQVKQIAKKEFVAAALNPKHQAFIVHITAFSVKLRNDVHSSKRIQINHLNVDEAPTKVPSKYANFADIMSLKLVIKLHKHRGINDHAIKFVNDWQTPYGPIYSLALWNGKY